MTIKDACYNLTRTIWDFNNPRKRHIYHQWMISHMGQPFRKVPESDCRLLFFLLTYKKEHGHCPLHEVYRAHHRRRDRERADGLSWPIQRSLAITRDNYTCQDCGRAELTGNDLTVDHVIPLFAGGTNDLKNLKTLCFRCHMLKNKQQSEDRAAWEAFKKDGLSAQLASLRGLLEASHASTSNLVNVPAPSMAFKERGGHSA